MAFHRMNKSQIIDTQLSNFSFKRKAILNLHFLFFIYPESQEYPLDML